MSEPTVEEVKNALAWNTSLNIEAVLYDKEPSLVQPYLDVVAAARLFVDAAEPDLEAADNAFVEWFGYMVGAGYLTVNKPMADKQPDRQIIAAAFGDNNLIRRAE